MRQIWLLACAGSVLVAGCLVDGTAQAPSDSSSGSTSNGTGGAPLQGPGGSASTGKGGTTANSGGGNTGTGGANNTGGSNNNAAGGTGTGKGGGNGVATGGAGNGEINPGVGNGFFPATLLPSHAKTAYTDWKTRYFVSCGGGQARVALDRAGGGKREQTVSEGIGYGMLLSVGHGDQADFDALWAYYKGHSSNGLMGWQVNGCGGVQDPNAATDADLDAAMALIQAACKWGGNYLGDAQTLIAAIKSQETIDGGEAFLKPAPSGLDGCQNVSYYAPGYYRAFAKVKPDQAGFWNKLASDSYAQLLRADDGTTGLVPNWSTTGGSAGCGGKDFGDRYGYDAARTPWRFATDYVWYGTPGAKAWLDTLVKWVEGPAGGIVGIGDMYTLSGMKESSNHNSTFTGGFALAAMAHSQAKADQYGTAFRAVSDSAYFEESLRAVYMLLAAGLFAPACN